MNKDYVDYQTALALKECGFDEPCDKGCRVIPGTEREEWDEEECQWRMVQDVECYPRITLWKAQKWLREVKGLYAYPEINALKKWFARVIDLNDNEELLMDGAMFNTYEEAQSHAIKCALQFIDNREI